MDHGEVGRYHVGCDSTRIETCMAAGLIGCAPVAPKDKEINVLCTPQEEWCQGMKQSLQELWPEVKKWD